MKFAIKLTLKIIKFLLFFLVLLVLGIALVFGVLAYLRWHPNNDAKLSVEPLKKFAIEYNSYTDKEHKDEVNKEYDPSDRCKKFPKKIDKDVADVLKHRVRDNEYKTYVSFVILKQYNCEFQYFGMGKAAHNHWDHFWNFNPLYRAYVYIVDGPFEYFTTDYIVDWILTHQEIMSNPLIKKELEHTEQICKLRFDPAIDKGDCHYLPK